MTESSYINSLANRPYRSTVKTLPATLPEPWVVIRGQSLAVKASRRPSPDRRTGVTWAGCRIWIDLGQGGRVGSGGACGSGIGRVMDGWRLGHAFCRYRPQPQGLNLSSHPINGLSLHGRSSNGLARQSGPLLEWFFPGAFLLKGTGRPADLSPRPSRKQAL